MALISIDNGRTYGTAAEMIGEIEARNLWEYVAQVMDDDTRETVHAELAPCSNAEFLAAYLDRTAEDITIG